MDRRNFFAKTVAGLVFGATSSKLFAENKPSKIKATVESGYFTLPYVPLTRTPVVLDKPTEWDKFADPISKYLKEWCSPYITGGCNPYINRDYKWFNKIVDAYDNNNFVIYTKYRQGGFSTLNIMYALKTMLEKQGTSVLFLAKTDRDSIALGEVFERILKSQPEIEYEKRSSHEFVLFDGWSRINFRNPMGCRGKSASHMFLDEAAFIPKMDEQWKAMYPVISCGGKVFVYSTPNGAGGWFSDTYHAALKDENFFNIPPFIEATESFSEEKLEKIKVQMGEREFYQEMMQSFL